MAAGFPARPPALRLGGPYSSLKSPSGFVALRLNKKMATTLAGGRDLLAADQLPVAASE